MRLGGGVGKGGEDLAVRRDHIRYAIGEGVAHNRDVNCGVIGFDDGKLGVGADGKLIAAFLA